MLLVLRHGLLNDSSPETRILWTVTSDGRNAAELIRDLEKKGRQVSEYARDIMSQPAFVHATGVTYRFVGIRGDEFADRERTTHNIFAEAARRGYSQPPAEVAALLREKFQQEELGYPYVMICHQPICGSRGYPYVLALLRDGADDWLFAWRALPDDWWRRGGLFLFLAPQVSA